MSSDENTVNNEAQAGPGSQLQLARESKQISLEEIANRTHISVSKLQALEENRFETLGPQPFIIGYIRKCAKILEIESDSLVEAYKKQAGVADELDAVLDQKTVSGAAVPGPAAIAGRNIAQTVRRIPVWWIVGGLVAVWIVGVYFLVPGEREQRLPRPAPAVQESVRQEPTAPVIDESVSEDSADEPVISEDSAVEEPFVIEESAPDEPESVPAEPVTAEAEPPAPSATTSNEADAPSGAAELSAAGPDQEGQDLLVMNFVDNCWVEVRDANDEIIFAALQTPADTLKLFGNAPFAVMLGNARAVSMAINGRTVDTQPRPGRNTLRLTVSP